MFSCLLSGFSNCLGGDKIHMAFMEAAGSPGDMRQEKRIRLKHAIITDSLRADYSTAEEAL